MDKGDVVKLTDGRMVRVISLPTSFLANGSYEVLHSDTQVKFWVKPEKIMYIVDEEFLDDINNYFEVIWDRIKFNYDKGKKHKTINIHIGDAPINDKDKITIRPKKEEKSKIEKIINVLKEKKDEI